MSTQVKHRHAARPPLTPEDPLQKARAAFAENDWKQLPVVEDGELVGVLARGALDNYDRSLAAVGKTFPLTVSPKDEVFEGGAGDYYLIGADALLNVRSALALAGRQDVARILDFGCGHGRVLRMLETEFPEASLTACDINAEATEFCAAEFGAQPASPEALRGEFDLIWVGSVLTHLDHARWSELLSAWEALLAEKGLLVFSTLGRRGAELIRNGTTYGLSSDALTELLSDYEDRGFGYQNYPHSDDYGLSLAKPSWVVSQIEHRPRVQLLMLKEAAWSDHQDITAAVKTS